MNQTLLARYNLSPYRAGYGAAFAVTVWDTHRYTAEGRTVTRVRIRCTKSHGDWKAGVVILDHAELYSPVPGWRKPLRALADALGTVGPDDGLISPEAMQRFLDEYGEDMTGHAQDLEFADYEPEATLQSRCAVAEEEGWPVGVALLAHHLGLTLADMRDGELNGDTFTCSEGEYLIFDDYADAERAATEDLKGVFEERLEEVPEWAAPYVDLDRAVSDALETERGGAGIGGLLAGYDGHEVELCEHLNPCGYATYAWAYRVN